MTKRLSVWGLKGRNLFWKKSISNEGNFELIFRIDQSLQSKTKSQSDHDWLKSRALRCTGFYIHLNVHFFFILVPPSSSREQEISWCHQLIMLHFIFKTAIMPLVQQVYTV